MRLRRCVAQVWRWLLPDHGGEGPRFKAEEDARAVIALRMAAAASAVTAMAFNALVQASMDARLFAFDLLIAGIGTAALASSWHPAGRRHARGISVFVGWLIGALIIADMARPVGHYAGHNGGLIIIMLVTGAIVPLRPLAGIGFSGVLTAMYLVGGFWLDPTVRWPLPYTFAAPLASLTVTSLLTGALLILVRSLRIREFRAREALAAGLAELERTQAELIAAEKAITPRRLATALSHELNTPLAVLSSNLELLDRVLPDLERGEESVELAFRKIVQLREVLRLGLESAGRIGELVKRIQRLTALDLATRRALDLNDLLEDALQLVLSESGRSGPKIIKELEPQATIVADAQGIVEVLTSVLRNAVEVAEERDELRVSTCIEGQQVVVVVADDGPGIPDDVLAEIFEPALRPRAGRIGAGWSLPVARQIVERHGGNISIRSKLHVGTEVRIELPFSAQYLTPPAGAPDVAQNRGNASSAR